MSRVISARIRSACSVFFILSPVSYKTEIIFDVIDISFDNSPDFLGVIPFLSTAYRSGISTKIFYQTDVDHTSTFR